MGARTTKIPPVSTAQSPLLQVARLWKHERSVKHNSRPEDRRDYRPIRPGAKPGERFLRGLQLGPLFDESIPGLATSQACLSLGLRLSLFFFLMDAHVFRIVDYFVAVARAPIRDDLCLNIRNC